MNGFELSLDSRPRPATVSPLVPGFVPPTPTPHQNLNTEPQLQSREAIWVEDGPNFEKFRAIAITTAVTHVLGTAPVSTLFQRASISRSIRPSSPLSISLRGHLDEFKQFHRAESFPFVLGSGLLDLCDGAVSGALLGVYVELSKVGWVLLTLGDEMDPVENNKEEKKLTLAQRARHLLYFGLCNAASFAMTATVCLPLHIANFQVRHHMWRGWRPGVFPLRANGYWAALPTLSIEYQFMQILNRRVRRYVYDLLGRPFSVPVATLRKIERQEKAARRRIKGKEKVVDAEDDEDDDEGEGEEDQVNDVIENGHAGHHPHHHRHLHENGARENGTGKRKGKETQQRPGKGKNGRTDNENEEEEEEEDLGDLGRELVRKVGFHVLTRGISIGVTLLTSVVHMPLCTITYSILASPHAYTGPIDCAQKILAAEGWQGFYKGLFWYVLYTSDVLFLHDVWTGAEQSLAD